MAAELSREAPSRQQPAPQHKRSHRARAILIHIVLLPAAVVFLLPFLWMLSTSLKPNSQLFAYPPIWIPNPIEWVNYPKAVNYIPFFVYLKNTLIISIASM